MTVVQSAGALTQTSSSNAAPSRGYGVRFYEDLFLDYAAIWRTQPNVRTVTGFLARNIAQLGLHVFERISDTERRRLADHPMAALIGRPNPWTTRYRWINALVHDLAIYDNHVSVKLRGADGRVWLLRIRPHRVEVRGSRLRPETYRIRLDGGGYIDVPADSIVHLRGYNPDDERWGVSPMETLRQLLAEDVAAGRYREAFWGNAARVATVVKRPLEAPPWSDQARRRFKTEFQQLYSGENSSGLTAILEEGMDLTVIGSSMKDAQYIETRKLTREEVASAFYVQPAMVGILEHANYANVREQHKALYQDTLAPWLTMIAEDLELQLLPDLHDGAESVYLEFNLAEKLRGTFEEQAQAMQMQVGAPIMTRNEGRARLNLPPIDGGDQLVTPLNVLIGGQASPRDSAPTGGTAARQLATKAIDGDAQGWIAKHREQLEGFFARQGQEIRSHLGAGAVIVEALFDRARWDSELADDLYALGYATAAAGGSSVAETFDIAWQPDDQADMIDLLRAHSEAAAQAVNDSTEAQLAEALDNDDPASAVDDVIVSLVTTTAAGLALSRTTTAWNQGQVAAGQAAGARTKTWRTTSGNPRSTHARLNGETVPLGEPFSNGAQWPGDPSLPTGERAYCECTVDIGGS